MNLLCILLPHFPLRCEILRRPELENTPLALVHGVGAQKVILDHAPELTGLGRDMPLTQALSRHGETALLPADIPHYWSVFNAILDALELRSPLVEGADLGEVYVGLDGLERLYPDREGVVRAMREAIPVAIEARYGIAENKFLARLGARDGGHEGYQTISGGGKAFLHDLPVDLLPVSLQSRARLHAFGLKTLGGVAALSAAQLQAQFGPEGKRIWALAQGRDETPFCPRVMAEPIEESTTLTSPIVSLDILLTAFEALLSPVFARLAAKGLGIRCIVPWTRTWLSEYWERRVYFKEPAMNCRAVLRRLRQVMESAPQAGPVEQLGLRITGLGQAPGRQQSIFSEVRSKDQLFNDVKQLELHLGAPQLFQIKELEPWSRIPERRYTLTPLNR